MLREFVTIKTATGDLKGYLYVGADGLPELRLEYPGRSVLGYGTETTATFRQETFQPSSFPAAWELQQEELDAGILFCAWRTIAEMQWDIAQAQREIEEGHDAD